MNKNKILQASLKSLVAFLGYALISVAITVIPGLLFMAGGSYSFNEAMNEAMQSIWVLIGIAILSPALNYLWIRFLLYKENSDTKLIGFTGKYISNAIYGAGAGLLVISIMIIPLYLSKSYLLEYHSLNIQTLSLLLKGLINFFAVAFTEELIFRGYIQYQFSKRSVLTGCILSALIFSAHHLVNSSYSLTSLIYLFLSGILFSVMRLATNSIVFTMGTHLMWNWLLMRVFGINTEISWMKTIIPKDTIWNGGNVGPEAGIWGLTTLFFAAGVFIFIYLKRKNQKSE